MEKQENTVNYNGKTGKSVNNNENTGKYRKLQWTHRKIL